MLWISIAVAIFFIESKTAFTVIGLLRDIQSRNGISASDERDLVAQIERDGTTNFRAFE